MNNDRFLHLQDAARYLGVSTRWMRRHYAQMIKQGVTAYRVPKNALKGRLMFDRASLDQYVKSCQISAGMSPL